jgi:excisionase family DNA binding protein
MPIDASTIISLQVAARIYGCTPATIRTFIADGRLPGYRIGARMIRVKRCDVEALMSPVPTTPAA